MIHLASIIDRATHLPIYYLPYISWSSISFVCLAAVPTLSNFPLQVLVTLSRKNISQLTFKTVDLWKTTEPVTATKTWWMCEMFACLVVALYFFVLPEFAQSTFKLLHRCGTDNQLASVMFFPLSLLLYLPSMTSCIWVTIPGENHIPSTNITTEN